MALSILYIGTSAPGSTTLHRACALERLGYEVSIHDPTSSWQRGSALTYFHYHTGFRMCTRAARSALVRAVGDRCFDVAWVGGGREIDRAAVEFLKTRARVVVNYNNDDPFGRSEGGSWDTYLRAVASYDLLAVMRGINVPEAQEHGARNVMRVFMSYDEVEHSPRALSAEEHQRWASEVSFVGTWRPERGPLLLRLLEAGVPLSLWGDRWGRAREWPRLRAVWRGPSLVGSEYSKAIQCSKIAIGLVSKGNRDQHTQRSMEIPALGTVLCAERTSEHGELFHEGSEAVLWSTPQECARACIELLEDEPRRAAIAARGKDRVTTLGVGNEPTMARILARAMDVGGIEAELGGRPVSALGIDRRRRRP